MPQFSIPKLVLRRLIDDWALLATLFMGIAAVATISALAPIYLTSLEQLAFNNSITKLSDTATDIDVFAPTVILDQASIESAERDLTDAIDDNISDVYVGREGFFKAANQLVGLPDRPLPEKPGTDEIVSRGYFQYLSNVGPHARFVDGQMARNVAQAGAGGPVVEAVIGTPTAERFQLGVGDMVTLTPDLQTPMRISARIVGIMEPDDPESRFWNFARLLLNPAPLEEVPPQGIRLADPMEEEPPVALFITKDAMIDVVGGSYAGTVVQPTWFIFIDREALKEWSLSEARAHVEGLDNDIVEAMPGASVSTRSVLGLIDSVKRRSFFSQVPLLLLLVLMVVTVFFYLSMMVTYLMRSRERDAALLRTRGVGVLQLSRIYVLEGLAMTVVGVGMAPFLAMAIVALAGKLPQFREATGAELLPIVVGPAPFFIAIGAGAASLLLLVVPGALSTRTGVLTQRLRSSRPSLLPFFQRYYLDAGILVLGGLTFWELRSRGHLISGGLFKDLEVNETLLLAPVLFLFVVSLLFMRFFPLLVRFVGGESRGLLDLLTVATIVSLAMLIVYAEARENDSVQWAIPIAIVLGFGAAYWAAWRSRPGLVRLGWILAQAAIVAGFVALRPPDPDDLTFTPVLALIGIVPAQIVFLALRKSVRRTPVWVSMSLWHMARNPMQYTWLVLLLVLVTGLAVLSTTVGGTLERSQMDRVLYETASDIRIADLKSSRPGGLPALKEKIGELPGVSAVSTAFRLTGSAGPAMFQVLGLEPREFASMSWYRSDFSTRPLSSVMGDLASADMIEPVRIPDDATELGMWVKPGQIFYQLSVWVVLKDANGAQTTMSLGKIGGLEWQLMTGDIPGHVKPPLSLVSVQVFEPGQDNRNTPGQIRIDDIHARAGASDAARILEDFEDEMTWIPIRTSDLSSEGVAATYGDAHAGDWAADYFFGSESQNGIRGIYRTPTRGPLPVVISTSLQAATGADIGSSFMALIAGQRVPVLVTDTIEYFPTVDPSGGGFMLVELESLLGHLNVLGSVYAVSPNEFFVHKDQTAGPGVAKTVRDLVSFTGRVQDRAERLEAVRLDPLTTAGWNVMSLLALAVVLLAGAFGYAAYLLVYARRSRGEVGFLESMGLARGQLMAMLAFEHLSIVAVGLGLGTWAGFRMSRLMITPLAVTEEGGEVVPPFILVTDWGMMIPTLVVLVAVFLAALVVLDRSISRLDLQAIARIGEA